MNGRTKRWTVDDIMDLYPCYSRLHVQYLFGRRKSMNARQLLSHSDVSTNDKLWLAKSVLNYTDYYNARVRWRRRSGGSIADLIKDILYILSKPTKRRKPRTHRKRT